MAKRCLRRYRKYRIAGVEKGLLLGLFGVLRETGDLLLDIPA